MSKPQDFFGASPKTVLNKPFAHFQDQKPYNVDGGTSIADAWTKRQLNTVISNDIQGASLANDEISLPAGTYYVEGTAEFYNGAGATSSIILGIFDALVKKVSGPSARLVNGTNRSFMVSGIVTLLAPGQLNFRYYSGLGQATDGLGYANSSGSIADTSLPSTYADLKIWQLDRSLEIAPKAVNAGLQTVPGLNTEGLILGGDVTVSGNTLTISKTSCMASDMVTPLATTADTQVVLPGTINQDFYTFIVRLVADGSFTMKAYTTYAGPSSDALVDKWRWLDYSKNNGSGVTMPYRNIGGRIDWVIPTNVVLTPSTTTSYVSYPVSTVVPTALMKSFIIQKYGTAQYFSYDGVNTFSFIDGWPVDFASTPSIFIRAVSATSPIYIASITLRR